MAIKPLTIKTMQQRKAKGKYSYCSLYPQRQTARKQLNGCSLALGGENKKSIMFYILPLCLFLVGGGLIGCGNSASLDTHWVKVGGRSVAVTKISDIQNSKEADSQVYLVGQVTNKAPLLTAGAYEIQDTSGKIWVITDKPLPHVGEQVLLKGQLQFQSIPVGGQELGEIYVQELKQLERREGQAEQPVTQEKG
ncbi:MAG: hypothetical protein WA919_01680 [Coleofasciculaceae cyanobacterium]